MNTQTVIELCESLLSRVEHSYLVQTFEVLARYYEKYWPIAMGVIEGATNEKLGQRVNGFTVTTREGISQVKGEINSNNLFLDAHAIQNDLIWLRVNFSDAAPLAAESALEAFVKSYQDFLNEQTHYNFVRLLDSAHFASMAFNTFIQTTKLFLSQLKPVYTLDEGEATLDIYFPSEQDFLTVLDKLASLRTIYYGIADIAGHTPDEWPLRLRKLEAGSLAITLTGIIAALTAMKGMITSAARRIWLDNTQAGRAARSKGLILDALEIRNELQKAGIDATRFDNNVTDLTAAFLAQVKILVDGESGIQVDHESFGTAIDASHQPEIKLLSVTSDQPNPTPKQLPPPVRPESQ